MNLAKAVAELISSNLKNGDGSPVECVIADSTIGRVAESAACAEKFEREGVGSYVLYGFLYSLIYIFCYSICCNSNIRTFGFQHCSRLWYL